jgi:3-oxoacyl-[acyl-carrier-protein] synthase II
MAIFIRSISGISPGSAPGAPVIPVAPAEHAAHLSAIEPDYTNYFDAKQIRRTSRIVRMGVAAALDCLRRAGEAHPERPNPDKVVPEAITTGTAYGCLEDTSVFLNRLVTQQEEMLSPTAFIQSTHNTVGAQIALLLQCTAYNNNFVHRGHSFESALLDAILLLKEGEARTVLTGAVDEITKDSQSLLHRFGLDRHGPIGEGAFFFLLATDPSVNDWARLDGLHMLRGQLTDDGLAAQCDAFLNRHSLHPADIDHVLFGGAATIPTHFAGKPCTGFKSFCGEYPTASAFALGLAASMIQSNQAGRILISNSYLNTYHSFVLVSNARK